MNYSRCYLFLFLCCAALAMGEEPPHTTSSRLTVGSGYTFLQQGQGNGNLGAFYSSYIYQSVGQFYSGITFKWEEGSIQVSERNKRLLDIDTQERLGYTFGQAHRNWILSLFTGLGYRYLNQEEVWFNVSFSSSHNNLYVPVGLFIEGKIGPYLQLGVSGQWRPQVYSAMTISSRHGITWITERKLANFLLEVPFRVKAHSNYQIYLTLNPFMDFWQEGQTLAEFLGGLPIPEQTFLFVGIDASLSLYF